MAVQEYVLLNDGKEQVYVTEYKERVESKILEVIDSHPAIAAIVSLSRMRFIMRCLR
jgi:type I restriction enzyme, R subunit